MKWQVSDMHKYFVSLLIASSLTLGTVSAQAKKENANKGDSCNGKTCTYIFDADDGLATVTVFKDDSVMVFDTGIDNRSLYEEMRGVIGDREIDLLVISTPRKEHVGLASRLVSLHMVETVIHPGITIPGDYEHQQVISSFASLGKLHNIDLDNPYTNLPRISNYRFGDSIAQIIQLENERNHVAVLIKHETYENARNCVRQDGTADDGACATLLLTGDLIGKHRMGRRATISDEASLIQLTYETDVDLDVDVLLVPNHGKNVASSLDFLFTVKPDMAVIAGDSSGSVRRRIEEFDTCLVEVLQSGTVTVVLDDNPRLIYKGQENGNCAGSKWKVPEKLELPVRRAPNGICYTKEFPYFEEIVAIKDKGPDQTVFRSMRECVESGGENLRP